MSTTKGPEDYKLYPNRYVDVIDNADNYFRPIWKDLGPEIRNRRVVDVGCGSGRFTACLALDYGCRVAGLDGNRYALEKALARGVAEVHEVADLSCDILPFDDATCEIVVNKDVLEHLIDPLHLLREINRILIMDGRLLLHVPNHFPLSGRIRFLFNGDIDPMGFCLGAKAWENPHIRFFRYDDIETMLALSGFSIRRNLSYHFPAIPLLHRFPDRLRMRILYYLADRYPSDFCAGYTVWAQKESTTGISEALR